MALVFSFYANSGLLTKNKSSLLNGLIYRWTLGHSVSLWGKGEWHAVLLL